MIFLTFYAIAVTILLIILWGEYSFYKWSAKHWRGAHDWQVGYNKIQHEVFKIILAKKDKEQDPADWWKNGRKDE